MERTIRLCVIGLLCVSLISASRFSFPQIPQAASVIYDEGLAPGWSDWSWATVDLASNTAAHNGLYSIAVTYGAWQGLYLHYPEVATTGYTLLRFFVNGGSTGGQKVNLYATRFINGDNKDGPAISLPPIPQDSWVEVRISLTDLDALSAPLTGLVWQDASGGIQPTLYIDDIALVSDESPDGPRLTPERLSPAAIPADGQTGSLVQVQVSDPQGLADIASVTVDLTTLGGKVVSLKDDGRSNDGAAMDGLFGGLLTLPYGASSGEATLAAVARDRAGHQTSTTLGSLVVLANPGGQIPAALPGHIAWGSNAWSETPGEDWQENSGVPWDYVYQYITYSWYTDGWGGNFVQRFVNQAWNKQYIPLISIYLILGLPAECGESPQCYAQKLQNGQSVQNYLAAIDEAARQAKGDRPVIFQLEPDFYGYMQQYTNSSSRPAGILPDDPSSIPVRLNKSGYPNNLAGFGRYLVDRIHTQAVNILVAPHASMWATNFDPNTGTAAEAINLAKRTAAFIDAMGGAEADLLTVEWSDRDAGSGLRPWWDDTNLKLPRPNRAILWENALSAASHKRLLLWQVPVGNMSLDNTCDHYQDNRAAYLFSHPRDIADAGVAGVLFGGGAACMTSVETDGGFIRTQGEVAYLAPGAPVGLQVLESQGASITLHWNDNPEPDLWGFRILLEPAGGGTVHTLDARRRNSLTLLLPAAGDWIISVTAYDAMGNVSPPSAPVMITITTNPFQLYLPAAIRN